MGIPIDNAPSDATGDSYMNLSQGQRNTIQAVERLGASLSLFGVFFIFVTYAAFKRLRTVPNTFILFASIANVGASTACLIGYSGVLAGDPSALCQVQAFLLEMFMQSDPWWSLAMAINVYMVFFLAANPISFRRYLWIYSLICFGLPAIPAFICLIVRDGARGLIYGNATLWCWIGDSYNSLRIFTYYLPIWTCILLSAVIYVAVGYHVFHQRNQLRNLTFSNTIGRRHRSGSDGRDSSSGEKTLASRSYGTVTTEVRVTTETSSENPSPAASPAPSIAPVILPPPSARIPMHPWALQSAADAGPSSSPYSPSSSTGSPFKTISSISSAVPRANTTGRKQKHARFSANRGGGGGGGLRGTFRKFVRRLQRLDPVKLAYLRTSFVFAISVLVTWTPSSINRVYTLVQPEGTNFPLNLASAVVLPLQGVWNAVIYAATSWVALRDEMRDLGRRTGWWAGGRDAVGCERLPDGWMAGRSPFGRTRSWTGGEATDIEMDPGGLATMRVIRGGSL